MAKSTTTNSPARFSKKGAGFYPDPDNDAECITIKKARRRLADLTEEYRFLQPEAAQGSGAALTRRLEISRDMRRLTDFFLAHDALVDITVPRSVLGEPFTINERQFFPGVHRVPGYVAQQLLSLIDNNRRVEIDRMKQNGREIDMGNLNDKAQWVRPALDVPVPA